MAQRFYNALNKIRKFCRKVAHHIKLHGEQIEQMLISLVIKQIIAT